MKIAVPDLVSNSYFPAIAAVALGYFNNEGIDIELELIFPVDKAYRALRDGDIEFVGGSAHSVPAAFVDWKDARLTAALAQGMYWFLVMRSDLNPQRGDLSIVKGCKIGAAPMVELGIRRVLADSGIDLVRDNVAIMPIPGSTGQGVSFGVNAAKALENNLIDGFWANGMGAEVAVRRGIGKIVIDARRGDGPPQSFHYTAPVLVTTAEIAEGQPQLAEAATRAVINAQKALKGNIALATDVGRKLFPQAEADLIAGVVARDLAFYDPRITLETFQQISAFATEMGLATGMASYEEIVPKRFHTLWDA